MTKKLALALLASVALVGCSSDSQRPDGQLGESTNLEVSKVVIAGKELICVDRYQGGVDCNWEAYNNDQ